MPKSVDLDTVLAAELELIEKRRAPDQPVRNFTAGERGKIPESPPDLARERTAQRNALEKQLFGLAFSGGGIRSATFNLGVLQRLAKHGLLRHVDYLSTVSGGGYIGSWLAAWIAREGLRSDDKPRESMLNVEKQLPPSRVKQASANRLLDANGKPKADKIGKPRLPHEAAVDQEPEAIYHLRAYSNYLAPKVGAFSADSWTLIAIYLRNVLLVQLMLFLNGLALVLATRGIVWLFTQQFGTFIVPIGGWTVQTVYGVGAMVAVLIIVPFARIAWELNRLHDVKSTRQGIGERSLHFWIIVPIGIAAILTVAMFTSPHLENGLTEMEEASSLRLAQATGTPRWFTSVPEWIRSYLSVTPDHAAWEQLQKGDTPWGPALVVASVFCCINGVINLVVFLVDHVVYRVEGKQNIDRGPENHLFEGFVSVLAGFGSGAIGGFLLFILLAKVLWPLMGQPYSAAAIATIGPPLVLAVFVAAAFSQVGLLGNQINEAEREWWSRVCAWCLIYAICWVAIFGISIFGLCGIEWLAENYHDKILSAATLGWVVTTIGGALAGKSPATKDGRGNRFAELIGTVAPYVFVIGLAIFVSWTASALLTGDETLSSDDRISRFWQAVNHPDGWRALWVVVVIVALWALLVSRIDVNIFSINSLYTNRLIRCYLGASRQKKRWDDFAASCYRGGAPTGSQGPERHENPVTGLDAADDFPLRNLRIGTYQSGQEVPAYWGPYPIINTAMNLVAGTELAWQERKAESFVLTPMYCGSRSTGYQKLEESADKMMTLGRAVGISGAAASPNMGYHTSPALMALMTVFNVRLGWWLQNPRGDSRRSWAAKSPPAGLWLLKELFGQTDETSSHVYLSDGGHFENLGIYELVRRRCRHIIVCDAGADPNYEFEDLAGAIRKVRTDFGIRIVIDVHPIRPQGSGLKSDWHCAVGTVCYSDVHGEESPDGVIVYIKTSMTGDEDSDIDNYQAAHPHFPHQTTGDQFFDESQFESYRALGEHVIGRVFGERGENNELPEKLLLETPGNVYEALPKFFARLQKEYMPLPQSIRDNLSHTSKGYIGLQHLLLGGGKDLAAISKSLYGHVLSENPPIEEHARIHFACWLFQVLENAWQQMDLDKYGDHPINRGWITLLTRWGASDVVQTHWDKLQNEFSQGFVDYFEPFVAKGRKNS